MSDDKRCKECDNKLSEFEISTAIETCGKCRFTATEQEHGYAQAELDRIREKGRERRWKFMENSKAKGKRQFSAILSGEAYDIMCGIRDKAQLAGNQTSFGEILEKALICYNKTINKSSINTTIVSSHEIINQTPDIEQPNAMPKAGNEEDSIDLELAIELDDAEDIDSQIPESETVVDGLEFEPMPDTEATDDQKPEPAAKPIQETQTEIPEPEPEPKPQTFGVLPERGTPEYSEWLFNEITTRLSTGLGYTDIENQFNSEGVKPAKADAWTRGGIRAFYKYIEKKLTKK